MPTNLAQAVASGADILVLPHALQHRLADLLQSPSACAGRAEGHDRVGVGHVDLRPTPLCGGLFGRAAQSAGAGRGGHEEGRGHWLVPGSGTMAFSFVDHLGGLFGLLADLGGHGSVLITRYEGFHGFRRSRRTLGFEMSKSVRSSVRASPLRALWRNWSRGRREKAMLIGADLRVAVAGVRDR